MERNIFQRKHDVEIDLSMIESARLRSLARRGLIEEQSEKTSTDI
ncbi:MAG: hypothetical protein QCI82_04190 [Candidatus Thermoplasmatota archaeon]|nr:hypothetical protein [Candidatus Thermoplasmatota archaeon]